MRHILFPLAFLFMVIIGLLSFDQPNRETEVSPVFNYYWSPPDDTIRGPDTLGNDGDTLTLYPEKNLDGRFAYNYTISVVGGDSLSVADALLSGSFKIYENNKDINDIDYADGWYTVVSDTLELTGILQHTGTFIYGRRQKLEIIPTDSFGIVIYDIDATFKRE